MIDATVLWGNEARVTERCMNSCLGAHEFSVTPYLLVQTVAASLDRTLHLLGGQRKPSPRLTGRDTGEVVQSNRIWLLYSEYHHLTSYDAQVHTQI